MGWQDRDYNTGPEARSLDRGALAVGMAARGAANVLLVVPVVSLAATVAAAVGWIDRSEPGAAALATLFTGLALSAIGSGVVFAERWLDTLPVKKLDQAAIAGMIVAIAAGVLHALALRQIIYSVATLRSGPVAGLEEALHPQLMGSALWLCAPGAVTTVAIPFGVLTAVRGDEEERELRQQVPLVALVSLGASLILSFVFFLHPGGGAGAPSLAARAALALVVPPLLGAALTVAARVSETFERHARAFLRLDG